MTEISDVLYTKGVHKIKEKMTTDLKELEQELVDAENRLKQLELESVETTKKRLAIQKMLEVAQESQTVATELLSTIDAVLGTLDDDAKKFVALQIINHLKQHTSPTETKNILNLDGITILSERFGAKATEDGYTYFCGMDYKRAKGDIQFSASIWRKFLIQNYPCDSVVIFDNPSESPIKGNYLVVANGATLRDVALVGNMNFEQAPTESIPEPLNINQDLEFFPHLGTSTVDVYLPTTPTPIINPDNPHEMIGRTISTNAYGTEQTGTIVSYVDGDATPWRVAVPDFPIELVLSTEQMTLV